MPLQIRRGTNAERELQTFIAGELVWITDEQQLVVGDGQTQGGITVSGGIGTTDVQAITAGMFTAGTHSNISFTYDQTNGVINASVSASSIDLSQIDGDIIPNQNDLYDIGSPEFQFSTVYTLSIQLGDAFIFSNADTVDLPLGSTIGGQEILSNSGGTPLTLDKIQTINNSLEISSFDLSNTNSQTLIIGSNNGESILQFVKNSNLDLYEDTGSYGLIGFERNDINGTMATAQIYGGGTGQIYISADKDGLPSPVLGEKATLAWDNGKLGIGYFFPSETLDVNGSGKFTGYIQFGSYTTNQRNQLTVANGMVIYNSTDNRFQGYQNNTWINLDDGSFA
jgi:hypothetical protein